MSRSYKKNPVCTDKHRKTTKQKKKFANKKVRKSKNLSDGKIYKKVSESYDIYDFATYWSWNKAKKDWKKNEYLQTYYPTLKDFYHYWLKHCKRK